MTRVLRTAGPAPAWAPEPPAPLPPGTIVDVRGRGEFFIRDSGGPGPVVLLLHGWMFSADLNFFANYRALEQAGNRVIAMDVRGHGRGLRTHVPFRLTDCADDAAAVLEQLRTGPAVVVGYSMGGAIAQLMARDHQQATRGVVLCATSREWRDPRTRLVWGVMAALRLILGLAPHGAFRRGLRASGFPDSALTTWVAAELTRGSARDIAEAGRELGRFDSRPWLMALDVPAAVIVTARDAAVAPSKQRALAATLRARQFEVNRDHSVALTRPREFNPVLLQAIAHVLADGAVGEERDQGIARPA
jgi:pimeloyl-ACP methyl ester carboxylesterase